MATVILAVFLGAGGPNCTPKNSESRETHSGNSVRAEYVIKLIEVARSSAGQQSFARDLDALRGLFVFGAC